jgi:hypothetical protein
MRLRAGGDSRDAQSGVRDIITTLMAVSRRRSSESMMMMLTPMQPSRAVANVWKVAPGENADSWPDFRDSGCTAIGWLDGNLNEFPTKEALRSALSEEYKAEGRGGAPYIWQFVHEMQLGDTVVANKGLNRVEGIGRVESGYLHPRHRRNPLKNKGYYHQARLVDWLITKPCDLGERVFNQPTVQRLDLEKWLKIKRAYREQFPQLVELLDTLLPRPNAPDLVAEDTEKTGRNPHLGPTEKKALIDARRGQGAFRQSVLQRWEQCCAITSSRTSEAIRASHIKPWRECTDEERLDPHNGLPLVASLDALFDAGLISFDADGFILVSPEIGVEEQKVFRLEGCKLREQPTPEMAKYLAFHREWHGFPV